MNLTNPMDKEKKTKTLRHKKDSIPYLKVVPELNSYGFVVIPVEGKKAILKKWNEITKTPDRLYIFENRNVAILTGIKSKITVLDIDVKDHGLTTWNKMISLYPKITTPMVRTGNGGLHIYFKYNSRLHSFSKFTLRDKKIGWDLLNDDRLVVVPPSINNSTYKWIVHPKDVPIATMPKWLEDYLHLMKYNK